MYAHRYFYKGIGNGKYVKTSFEELYGKSKDEWRLKAKQLQKRRWKKLKAKEKDLEF